MRKNPYNKGLKDQFPLFMSGPSTITALIENEEQKDIVEKSVKIPLHKYEVNGVTFTMVQPPVLNPDFTLNPQDNLNIEMGQTEVTQKLFEAVMGWDDSQFKDPKNPVEKVTWYDCISFCNKLSNLLGLQPYYEMKVQQTYVYLNHIGKAEVTRDETANGFRLPTEYEWELFAKAGTQNRWAGTDAISELKKYAWYEENAGTWWKRKTRHVGRKLPNEWGLYDMTGNVDEWCWDIQGKAGYYRGYRGGRYHDYAYKCYVDRRDGEDPQFKNPGLGFRICRTIK